MNLLDLRLHGLEGPWQFTSPSKPTALSNEVQEKLPVYMQILVFPQFSATWPIHRYLAARRILS